MSVATRFRRQSRIVRRNRERMEAGDWHFATGTGVLRTLAADAVHQVRRHFRKAVDMQRHPVVRHEEDDEKEHVYKAKHRQKGD